MNKKTFTAVLECAILSFEGYDLKSLINFGFAPEVAQTGVNLCDFLKNKELEVSNGV